MPQFDQVRTGATALGSRLPPVGGGVRASNVHLVPRRARGVDGHGSVAGEGLKPADPTAARGHADGARDASAADFHEPGATANIPVVPDQCAQSAISNRDRPNRCRNRDRRRGLSGRSDASFANIMIAGARGSYGKKITSLPFQLIRIHGSSRCPLSITQNPRELEIETEVFARTQVVGPPAKE
jgi:hypothetical protein